MKATKFSSYYLPIILLLGCVLLFSSLNKMPLYIYDEARNAQCAREMLERNDWIVPTFNGELRTQKPVLPYYFMMGSYKLFGLNPLAARFFSAVFGLLTLLITYLFTARYSSKLHAFISCCVLLASTHFLFEFRMSVPDPYLIFFNTLSIFTAYYYFEVKKLWALLISAASFGLGMLAKGPVALALPALALLCWLIWQRRWKAIFHWHIVAASMIMLALTLPWYIAVHFKTNGAWTQGFFLENNLNRFSEPMEGHGGIFLLVPLFILLGLLPASVFMGESVKNFRQRFSPSFLKLAFCVLGVFTVFYSFSGTKLPNYPMPGYPFTAIILGYFFSLAINHKTKTKLYPFYILFLINLGLPVGLYVGIRQEVALAGYENLAGFLLILPIAAITALLLFRKKGIKSALISLLIFYTLFNAAFFNYLYPTLYQNNPLSQTISEVKKHPTVIAYKTFQPSFTFYLPERIPVFKTPDSLSNFLDANQALILTRKNLLPELDSLNLTTLSTHHDIFEDHTTVLLTNTQ